MQLRNKILISCEALPHSKDDYHELCVVSHTSTGVEKVGLYESQVLQVFIKCRTPLFVAIPDDIIVAIINHFE